MSGDERECKKPRVGFCLTHDVAPRGFASGILASVLAALIFLSISPASGQVSLDPENWPLSSVGRVNVVAGARHTAHCTGTLVGPRHVLTAAHCLYNKRRGVWAHPSSIHFVAGYSRDKYEVHSVASSYQTGQGFQGAEPPIPSNVSHDWAIIQLAKTLNLKPVPVSAEITRQSRGIVRAGYRGDRAHILTLQTDCYARGALRANDDETQTCREFTLEG